MSQLLLDTTTTSVGESYSYGIEDQSGLARLVEMQTTSRRSYDFAVLDDGSIIAVDAFTGSWACGDTVRDAMKELDHELRDLLDDLSSHEQQLTSTMRARLDYLLNLGL